jgi:TonB-linked SusC/RagA family outer membrane protein
MFQVFKSSPSLFSMLTAVSLCSTAFAQTARQGQIIDADNKQPIAGVTIQLVGQQRNAVSDLSGKFEISPNNENDVVEISYIGYQTIRIPVSQLTGTIEIQIASRDLDEVIVVAYGTNKRSSFTGSVSTISNKQLENRQVSNLSKAFEGQVPGLQSVAASGQPGTESTLRIRGIGSINASSAPLFVVDGNPYAGDINAINPNDIQSVSVLKDAASSALYGSRGANGVIIVTTKSGRNNSQTSINLNATQGFTGRAVEDYAQVNTDQYFELYWEALRNKALSNGLTAEQAARNASQNILTDLNIKPYGSAFANPVGLDGKLVSGAKALWDNPWTDVLQQTGKRSQVDLSFGGGSEKSKFYIAGGYLNEEGIAIASGFKRYNVRANLDAQARTWLNVGLNIAGSSTNQKYPQSEDSNTANIINFTRLVPSFYPYYERDADGGLKLDANGNPIYDFGEYRPSAAIPRNNLAASLPLDKNDINRENVSARTYLEAIITPALKFRSTYSVDYVNNNSHYYVNPVVGAGVPYAGSVSKSNSRTVGQTWNNLFTYEQSFDKHNINLLAGQEYYSFNTQNISGSRERFVLPGLYEPIAASQLNSFTGSSVDYRLLSFLGRAEYNYDNRYFLSGSLRTDGSSRFAPETRWGTFWSVGGSWKIAEEAFLRDYDFLDQLTLRASYGGQGNDNLGTYYAYEGLYTIANSLGEGGSLTSRLPTPDLKWETNLNLNIGLDVAILANRISWSVEYFNRQSKNLLFTMPMPLSTGYTGYDANIGSLRNTGVDFDLRTVPVSTADFKWNLDLNLSHYINRITELPNEQSIISGNKILTVGSSIYDFYLPSWAGVDPTNGNPLWYLADDQGNISSNTTSVYGNAARFNLGSSLPKVVGGIQNSFSFKGVDLVALLSFSLGGQILDSDYTQLMHNGNNAGRTWSTEILERWTPENTNTDVPKLTTDNLNWTSASSRFLYSGSYARLKNLSLGYTFDQKVISALKIQSARIFLTGENLLTFYKHKGMDPEQTLNGATYFRYPAIRTFSAGIQLAL